jgi:ribosomal protein S18 acetylase RimI-like enzyme
MSQRYYVKQMTIDDIPQVYELGVQSFLSNNSEPSFVYNYWTLVAVAQIMQESPEYAFVVKSRGKVVGFVLGHPNYEGIIEEIGYLEWIAVAPEARGKGLAKRLIKRILDTYKANGITKIVTDIKAVNQASIHLFQQFGFEVKESVSFLMKDL